MAASSLNMCFLPYSKHMATFPYSLCITVNHQKEWMTKLGFKLTTFWLIVIVNRVVEAIDNGKDSWIKRVMNKSARSPVCTWNKGKKTIPIWCIKQTFNPFPHTPILQQTTLNIFCQQMEYLYNWMDNLRHCGKKNVCCRGVRKCLYEGKGKDCIHL